MSLIFAMIPGQTAKKSVDSPYSTQQVSVFIGNDDISGIAIIFQKGELLSIR